MKAAIFKAKERVPNPKQKFRTAKGPIPAAEKAARSNLSVLQKPNCSAKIRTRLPCFLQNFEI